MNPTREEIEKAVVYQITKEQCQDMIKGVCEGCGGKLEPIDTVDNSGNPTFWVGCRHCNCFRGGIEKRYWEVARKLVENGDIIPYSHMCRIEYEKTKEQLEYWLDTQTAGLSYTILKIDKLLHPGDLFASEGEIREIFDKKYYAKINTLSDNELWKFCRSSEPMDIVLSISHRLPKGITRDSLIDIIKAYAENHDDLNHDVWLHGEAEKLTEYILKRLHE